MTERKDDKEPSKLQHVQAKLAQNTLTEFKIGFEHMEIRSKRDVQSLIATVRDHYLQRLTVDKFSSLESIRIGWKLPHFALGPILQQVVPMLLTPPARVQHLQLVVNAWIPLPVVQTLVSWHTLETLDLRSFRIQTKTMSERRPLPRAPAVRHDRIGIRPSSLTLNATTKTDLSLDDDDGESRITSDDSILSALPLLSPSIKTLKLIDCNLHPRDMPELIERLRRKRSLRFLSLRHNRRLFLNGWEKTILKDLRFLECLDLSLCDLDVVDGFALARALEERKAVDSELTSLSIAGNYRLPMAVPRIVEASAMHGILELDCSFCDVQNKIQSQIFDCLATIQPCALRCLKMQSVRIKDCGSLIQCVQHNKSLERLILNHPREPYLVSNEAMDNIKDAIPHNYHLHTIQIDTQWDQDQEVLDSIEYWLTLNRVGRSIVVQDETKSWPNVLTKAAALNNADMLYWIIRNGVDQFEGQVRITK